eukprot:CAMPEP_0194566740 /NCGR_PEP_ID=MMETSP0292-20121207/5496_1 /TAXON_ID=39354 /ORGANISM="Heterosigma akashiwo, Strain CCMP2393" /LENGTH=130 /DNA_ID=CAMNT_0039416373 /DNA_START=84 /DNA_END=476 /DNA_ORIENTATION=+
MSSSTSPSGQVQSLVVSALATILLSIENSEWRAATRRAEHCGVALCCELIGHLRDRDQGKPWAEGKPWGADLLLIWILYHDIMCVQLLDLRCRFGNESKPSLMLSGPDCGTGLLNALIDLTNEGILELDV